MPVRVRYKNLANQECTIRPTPLIAISSELNTTGAGDILGVTYTITLTGKLLPDEGTPYGLSNITGGVYRFFGNPAVNYCGPYNSFDNNISHYGNKRPPRQIVVEGAAAQSIFMKQRSLRELFANHGQRVEISDVEFDSSSIVCFPRIVNISFSEGQYITSCDYTITLEADSLFSTAGAGSVDTDGMRDQSDPMGNTRPLLSEQAFVDDYANAYVKDFQESWAIEVDESMSETMNLNDDSHDRTYRITHNISAVGKDHYSPTAAHSTVRLTAWTQAKKFVTARLSYAPEYPDDVPMGDPEGTTDEFTQGYPNQTGVMGFTTNWMAGGGNHPFPNFFGKIGAGTIDLLDDYGGYNHTRTENIDETAGSYSVTESWLMARGSAYETYNLSLSSSTGGPFTNIAIQGNIKGLSKLAANALEYGGKNNRGRDPTWRAANGLANTYLYTKYESALQFYNNISNNGFFGVGSLIYKRANNQTQVQLNSEPLSISLGMNKKTGEITYSLEFDNRPTNIVSNVLSETINVNDTYPGDVFATIPVIGRATGPVLQYIGGRTEYKRDVAINLLMDSTKIPYDSGRPALLLTKPSVSEPMASELATLIESLSPANEPGVRKYFIGPPSESWEPKVGNYSINLSFTYELDK